MSALHSGKSGHRDILPHDLAEHQTWSSRGPGMSCIVDTELSRPCEQLRAFSSKQDRIRDASGSARTETNTTLTQRSTSPPVTI